jgi:GNAT superfamily N-acetyltransferase
MARDGVGVKVAPISPRRHHEVAAVLVDAFYDYPVMRYVVGDAPDYEARLQQLIEFFVFRRVRQGGLLFGVDRGAELLGAAVLATPRETKAPPEVKDLALQLWSAIGEDARLRFDTYGAATQRFAVASPHHHLSMIGVRRAHHGDGLARPLLDVVTETSVDDAESAGVSLTTELLKNVQLYEHFGYRVIGHAHVTADLETWGLFRSASLGRETP